jgi:CheY-like chemotaxis protein
MSCFAVTTNRAMLKRAIMRALPGSKFFEAENGREAVAEMELHGDTIDVICMDKEMPVRSASCSLPSHLLPAYIRIIHCR